MAKEIVFGGEGGEAEVAPVPVIKLEAEEPETPEESEGGTEEEEAPEAEGNEEEGEEAEEADGEEEVEEEEALKKGRPNADIRARLSEMADQRDELQLKLTASESKLSALEARTSAIDRAVEEMYDGNLNAMRYDHEFVEEVMERIDADPNLRQLLSKELLEAVERRVEKRGKSKMSNGIEQNPIRAARPTQAPASAETPKEPTKSDLALARINRREATTILDGLEVKADFHRLIADAVVEAAGDEHDITEEFVVEQVKAFAKKNKIKSGTLLKQPKLPSKKPPTAPASQAAAPTSGNGGKGAKPRSETTVKERLASRAERLSGLISELGGRAG